MTRTESALNTLAEVAATARKELEKQLGQSVVTTRRLSNCWK